MPWAESGNSLLLYLLGITETTRCRRTTAIRKKEWNLDGPKVGTGRTLLKIRDGDLPERGF